jgi:S-adenosylmethionine hydrolase
MISILSDFGLEDTYVAAMKAVLHTIAPSEKLLDLTHDVPPGDVMRGALELWRIAPFLPSGTVILGVVDPGVGTERKAIAFRNDKFTCVGPDNGLFGYLLDEKALISAVELSNKEYQMKQASMTFHGRDIFAPAAAYLATGVPLTEFGPHIEALIRLPQPALKIEDGGVIRGEILYSDRFGNLVTSIGKLSRHGSILVCDPWIGENKLREIKTPDPSISLPDGSEIKLMKAFGDVPEGSLTAYIGSSGLLEIAVNSGSASESTGLQRGDHIELKP